MALEAEVAMAKSAALKKASARANADGFDKHHYAFHVSDQEFDAIFKRVQEAGIPFGSWPTTLEDGKLNSWNGGRGVYFCDPNGHILELMTRT